MTTATPSLGGSTISLTRSGTPGWAKAGALAGLAATAAFLTSSGILPQDDAVRADNAVMAAELVDKEMIVWLFQVLCSSAALGVAWFAAGLRRRLAAQAPADSLLPALAAAGLGSVALMLLVGGGISTELFWHLTVDVGETDPDTVAGALTVFNTMAWVWAGAGLAAGAVAITSLRHGALPRWLGWSSAVAATLILITQLVPLQYMAGFVGAPWLVVAGIGLALHERPA